MTGNWVCENTLVEGKVTLIEWKERRVSRIELTCLRAVALAHSGPDLYDPDTSLYVKHRQKKGIDFSNFERIRSGKLPPQFRGTLSKDRHIYDSELPFLSSEIGSLKQGDWLRGLVRSVEGP